MWNLSLLLCLFPALTHTLLERQWGRRFPLGGRESYVPVRGAVARWWSLFPLGLALPYPDRHVYTSLHHTSRGPTVQAKTKLEGASQPGPALVVPVNLPCTAVMRVHG